MGITTSVVCFEFCPGFVATAGDFNWIKEEYIYRRRKVFNRIYKFAVKIRQ
ncbi:hypothetical protein D3C87_1251760 [compost metagenome]